MATNTTNKKTNKETTDVQETIAVKAQDSSTSKPRAKKIIPKEIDASQYVTVRNGFHGKLIYISKRTGEEFVWDAFGDSQEMELRELRNAKSSSKGFFADNLFMFDEDWVIDYLGVGQYYKHALSIKDFDNIFKQSPEELRKTLSDMTDGQKRSLSYRARKLIDEGVIDSLAVINVIEECLNIELIER